VLRDGCHHSAATRCAALAFAKCLLKKGQERTLIAVRRSDSNSSRLNRFFDPGAAPCAFPSDIGTTEQKR
jgi:hypothetical protein